MSEEEKKKKYMREYRIFQSSIVLKNIKESNETKSVEADVITNFVKDKVESSSDAEVYNDDDDDSDEYRTNGFR